MALVWNHYLPRCLCGITEKPSPSKSVNLSWTCDLKQFKTACYIQIFLGENQTIICVLPILQRTRSISSKYFLITLCFNSCTRQDLSFHSSAASSLCEEIPPLYQTNQTWWVILLKLPSLIWGDAEEARLCPVWAMEEKRVVFSTKCTIFSKKSLILKNLPLNSYLTAWKWMIGETCQDLRCRS